MSDIPTDLFHEILKRVPVKSLFCFKSVCKAWCNIIDDPDFAKLHINRGLGDDYLILRKDTGDVFLLPLHHFIISRPKKCIENLWATNVKNMAGQGVPCVPYLPVRSCNGLILISPRFRGLVWLVWNPFTCENLAIPRCDEFPSDTSSRVLYTGIDYDEANDDYKVVRIVCPHTFIYSLSLRSWRRIEGFPDCDAIIYTNEAFAYGALHWLIQRQDRKVLVVALDLSTETFRTIPIPQKTRKAYSAEIHGLGDCLFLSWCRWAERVVVWMIKDYGCENTWVKVISVKPKKFLCNFVSPLAYLKSKGQLLLHTEQTELLCYDLENNCLARVSLQNCDSLSFQVLPASLVRLSRQDGSCEGVSYEETSKRKREGPLAERLRLKATFGSPNDW